MTASKVLLLFILSLSFRVSFGQASSNNNYESAYNELVKILEDRSHYSFKKAVVLTESTFDQSFDSSYFESQVRHLVNLCNGFIQSNQLNYIEKDKAVVEKWAAIFKVVTDTIYQSKGGLSIPHLPFTYDFDDFFGENDWTKMFVSKLLDSGSGNCHSLPYLYKILAEEMGTTAQLALAPNHIYIKHRSLKTGMFNTELTSATFPIDAWIMASGYIHLTAIQNSVFMKALNDKESIALCLIDLAEGYKRRTNNLDPNFIIKCSDKALEYFPNYVNALILKAETIKSQHDQLVVDNPNPTNEIKLKTQSLFNQMQDLYVRVHKLGYRQMPKDMYMKWLVELKTEKEKYQNKNVSSYDK